jgi:hypothetical protein
MPAFFWLQPVSIITITDWLRSLRFLRADLTVTLCQKIVATFTNTANPYVDERVVQDCLLLPNSGADLKWIDTMAEAAVTRGSAEAAALFQTCKAMSIIGWGIFAMMIGKRRRKKFHRRGEPKPKPMPYRRWRADGQGRSTVALHRRNVGPKFRQCDGEDLEGHG